MVRWRIDAAVKYCQAISEIKVTRNEKPWKYDLILRDKTDTNMSFLWLDTEYGRSLSAAIV